VFSGKDCPLIVLVICVPVIKPLIVAVPPVLENVFDAGAKTLTGKNGVIDHPKSDDIDQSFSFA
jgi:hypothetical protein